MSLRLVIERFLLLGDSENVGLRVLAGRREVPAWWPAHRAAACVVASMVDDTSGVAAFWVALRPHSRRPWDHLWLYERVQDHWEALGGDGACPVERNFLDHRPSAALSGPAGLILPAGGASVISRSRHGDDASTGQARHGGWIAGEIFRVATEVREVGIGSARGIVPEHGYFATVWRSKASHFRSERPVISCLDAQGATLTTLGPGEYIDQAIADSNSGLD